MRRERPLLATSASSSWQKRGFVCLRRACLAFLPRSPGPLRGAAGRYPSGPRRRRRWWERGKGPGRGGSVTADLSGLHSPPLGRQQRYKCSFDEVCTYSCTHGGSSVSSVLSKQQIVSRRVNLLLSKWITFNRNITAVLFLVRGRGVIWSRLHIFNLFKLPFDSTRACRKYIFRLVQFALKLILASADLFHSWMEIFLIFTWLCQRYLFVISLSAHGDAESGSKWHDFGYPKLSGCLLQSK